MTNSLVQLNLKAPHQGVYRVTTLVTDILLEWVRVPMDMHPAHWNITTARKLINSEVSLRYEFYPDAKSAVKQ
jgi:hypothetical protein